MKKRLFLIPVVVAVIVLIPLAVSVLSEESDAPTPTLSYTLDWEWGNAVPLDDGGWQVVNDMGYTVVVEEAALVSYSVQMVECDHEHPEDETALFAIPRAFAGHGDGVDPSMLEPGMVENLAEPTRIDFGSVAVADTITYCQAHYLIARADDQVRGVDEQMLASSFLVRGQYQASDASEFTPFTLQTSQASGVISDLKVFYAADAHIHLKTGRQSAAVTFVRQLDRLFDGVDFESMDADEQARAILRSLVKHTSVTITAGETFAATE